MIPVDQTIFTVPGGNCLSACVASILHLNVQDVPPFCDKEDWLGAMNEWLHERGLWAMCFFYNPDVVPRGYWILGGKSPRGDFLHAVVCKDREMVHDPHPSRDGVETRVDCTLIMPLDMSEFVRRSRSKPMPL